MLEKIPDGPDGIDAFTFTAVGKLTEDDYEETEDDYEETVETLLDEARRQDRRLRAR